jgi:hypothetical protein
MDGGCPQTTQNDAEKTEMLTKEASWITNQSFYRKDRRERREGHLTEANEGGRCAPTTDRPPP